MLHILALIPWYLSSGYTVQLYLDNLNTLNFITECCSSTVDLSAIAGNIVQVPMGCGCISKEAGYLFDQKNDLQAGKKEMENIKYLRRLCHEAKTVKET